MQLIHNVQVLSFLDHRNDFVHSGYIYWGPRSWVRWTESIPESFLSGVEDTHWGNNHWHLNTNNILEEKGSGLEMPSIIFLCRYVFYFVYPYWVFQACRKVERIANTCSNVLLRVSVIVHSMLLLSRVLLYGCATVCVFTQCSDTLTFLLCLQIETTCWWTCNLIFI